jgi:chemotaxis protein methyltransferase CheR
MPDPTDLEFAWFKKKILELTGVNLDSYRPQQMQRILEKAMHRSGCRNYAALIRHISQSPARIQDFRDAITINVSSLFRDKKRWDELNVHLARMARARARDRAMPPRRRTLRAWSAGCSIGAEPYTLAMLLCELRAAAEPDPLPFKILATDLDRSMIQRAREGVYTGRETREVPPSLLNRYFVAAPQPASPWARNISGERYFEAVPALREHVEFRLHNLLEDPFDHGFDLIVCRNVIIYFTNDAKERLFLRFRESLNPGGLLFIGGTEVIFRHERYGIEPVGAGIYARTSDAPHA